MPVELGFILQRFARVAEADWTTVFTELPR